MLRLFVTMLLLCLLIPVHAATIETGDDALDAAFAQLLERDFAVKAQGVDAVANSGHAKSTALLRGLLEGDLRYLSKERRLVWMEQRDGERVAIDVLNGNELGTFGSRSFKKFAINNAMRRQTRALLAMLDL
jgi:urea transport system permease protein